MHLIEQFISDSIQHVGATLQAVRSGDSSLALQFFDQHGAAWLIFDLEARFFSCRWTDALPSMPKRKKPLALFTEAHFVGQELSNVVCSENTIALIFNEARLTIWWQKDGLNVRAQTSEKSIHWKKPNIGKAWPAPATSNLNSVGKLPEPKTELADPNEKLKRTIAKVEAELAEKEDSRWRDLGNFLIQNPDQDPPAKWTSLMDHHKSRREMIEFAFSKAKHLEKKLSGTRSRLIELKERLKTGSSPKTAEPAIQKGRRPKKTKAELPKLRKMDFGQGLIAWVGKSGRDNLKLLREAQPWHLWLHLRDEPSSHCLIHIPKGAKINDKTLHLITQWYLKIQLGSKASSQFGEKFDVLVAECRYVKPVKGSTGLVTYKNERTLRHIFRVES